MTQKKKKNARRKTPHSQRVLLRLRRQLLNMNQEERKWKKWRESEGCSSELMIRKRWETGICNIWESRSPQRARAKPFGSKRPDQPPSVRFPRLLNISGILTRPGW